MALYKIRAINLKVSIFGEADKVVTVFSREHGKLRVLAKGARKSGSKLSGRTELFVLSLMALATGRNFEILTDAQIIESFPGFRNNLSKVNLGLYFLWLVDQILPLNHAAPAVFDLLESSLMRLAAADIDEESLKDFFERELALLEGVQPIRTTGSLKTYFENYFERIYPCYFGEFMGVSK